MRRDRVLGSRGGFSMKIHLKVDLGGLPLAFHPTGGEASDSRNFEILLDLGPDIAPSAAITDKGYDAKANRDGARRRSICPVIPFKSNAIDKPAFFPKILYKARARIEQAGGKLINQSISSCTFLLTGHPCANCNRSRKNRVFLPKIIAQICRLTVHLLMD